MTNKNLARTENVEKTGSLNTGAHLEFVWFQCKGRDCVLTDAHKNDENSKITHLTEVIIDIFKRMWDFVA
jgi:predicted amidohydrolase